MWNDRCDKKPYFTYMYKNYVLVLCHDNIITLCNTIFVPGFEVLFPDWLRI